MTTSGFPEGHALLIGVAAYEHIRPLPTAILNDVDDLAKTLTSQDLCGYESRNVVALKDASATRTAVLAEFAALAARVSPQDTACVFFSGHGARLDPASDESALLCVDFDRMNSAETSISAAEFSAALQSIKAQRLLVFIDACHSGGAGSFKGSTEEDDQTNGLALGYSEKSLGTLAVGTGRAMMTSSRLTEESIVFKGQRNSAFTAVLLKGLHGAADAGNTGFIKVFELFSYVSENVQRATSEDQHPNFKCSEVEGNFPVALSRGGKKSLDGSLNRSSAPIVRTMDPDGWARFEAALIDVYPMGPRDQEVWSRAGGDLSRLQLQGSGVAAWHAALKVLRNGGGGKDITVDSLLKVALTDFGSHTGLLGLA